MRNLSDISEIKDICSEHGFAFSKSLGQNFLINPSVCPRIAEMGGVDENHGVIEIGTGFGVLTAELCKRAKKVVAIEIDSSLIPVLKDTMSEFDNLKVINADVLDLDLKKLIDDEFGGMKVVVCANLPYYITSPIIMGILQQRLDIESVTVMVQREAAVRLCAAMGSRECGAVTAAVNYYSSPQKLFDVSRGSFMPAPNVDSSVIRLDIKPETAAVADEGVLFKLIRSSFSQRRKAMRNPISAAFKLPKSEVSAILSDLNLNPQCRPEELTLEQFIAVADALYGKGARI